MAPVFLLVFALSGVGSPASRGWAEDTSAIDAPSYRAFLGTSITANFGLSIFPALVVGFELRGNTALVTLVWLAYLAVGGGADLLLARAFRVPTTLRTAALGVVVGVATWLLVLPFMLFVPDPDNGLFQTVLLAWACSILSTPLFIRYDPFPAATSTTEPAPVRPLEREEARARGSNVLSFRF